MDGRRFACLLLLRRMREHTESVICKACNKCCLVSRAGLRVWLTGRRRTGVPNNLGVS